MRALFLDQGGLQYREDYQPGADPGEIHVDVHLAGICETDLQLVGGYMEFSGVLGHEFVGVALDGKFAGERVVGEINCGCGECEYCQQGLRNHCPHRSVLGILNHDGAFADTVFVPEANLHAVPDSVPDHIAVFTEPLAAAFEIPARTDLSQFAKVVVIGDGRLGYLVAQVLGLHECDVLVVGRHKSKLAKFRELGIDTQLESESQSTREFDLAIDCCGSPTGLETALRFLKPRGTLVLKSTYAGEQGPNPARLVIDEITVVGNRCGPFDVALLALEKHSVEVESLITAQFPLEEAIAAMEAAAQPDQRKVLLQVAR